MIDLDHLELFCAEDFPPESRFAVFGLPLNALTDRGERIVILEPECFRTKTVPKTNFNDNWSKISHHYGITDFHKAYRLFVALCEWDTKTLTSLGMSVLEIHAFFNTKPVELRFVTFMRENPGGYMIIETSNEYSIPTKGLLS